MINGDILLVKDGDKNCLFLDVGVIIEIILLIMVNGLILWIFVDGYEFKVKEIKMEYLCKILEENFKVFIIGSIIRELDVCFFIVFFFIVVSVKSVGILSNLGFLEGVIVIIN